MFRFEANRNEQIVGGAGVSEATRPMSARLVIAGASRGAFAGARRRDRTHLTKGPRIVARRGAEAAVLVPIAEWRRI
jgi:hypothetical protein